MKKNNKYLLSKFLIALSILTGCSSRIENAPDLTKCINLGNCLEAPKDQPWDVPMNIRYFSLIKQAGFTAVRIPVRFSDYVNKSSTDYMIKESFLQQTDAYLLEAINQDLTVILDLHHFTEIMENPEENKDILLSIWMQLAARYQDYPDTLLFELLNEPQNHLDSATWNEYLSETVSVIREIDTTHYIIIGGTNYNSIDALWSLELPKDDKLIATFHYYEPSDVAFQGNEYHEGFENLKDITWEGTKEQMKYLTSRFDSAKAFSEKYDCPLFVGEFGVNQNAPEETREAWTNAVVSQCYQNGFGFGYWELASGFGIYDLNTGTWNNDLLNALLQEPDAHK